MKFGNDEQQNLWKKTITISIPKVKIDPHKDSKTSFENMHPKEEKQTEYMEVEEDHSNKPLPATPFPRKSFPSFFSIQSAPSTPLPLQTSSNPFGSNLYRSSRSDVSDLVRPDETDKKNIFSVSKSFGQFTFNQHPLTDSKEELCVKMPKTSRQDFTVKENTNIKQEINEGKKKLRHLMPVDNTKKKPIYSCSCWQIIFFLLLPIAVVLISTILSQQQIASKFCDPSFNFTNVTKQLKKLVYGQNRGVADITNFFETSVENFKIFALVGGTGVGKTHVANVIKSSLPENYYSFEYFPPLYNKIRQVYSELSTCQCNLLILENLGTEDISDAAFFSQALKNRATDLCVFILALFNTQVTDNNLRHSIDLEGSVKNIEDGFRKEGIEVKAVGFEPLSEESIMKCIMEAIKDSHLKLSEEDIIQVRQSLYTANSGCKGAYSKVQLLGKIPN